jgi:hypothetical protein
MELLVESGLIRHDEIADLLDETNQIVAIIVASIRAVRSNR